MDVARWYAPGEASGAIASGLAIRSGANPSMDVAQWYAGPELSFVNASQALQAGANPSMDVARWYTPGEASSEVLLCLAEGLSVPCP